MLALKDKILIILQIIQINYSNEWLPVFILRKYYI